LFTVNGDNTALDSSILFDVHTTMMSAKAQSIADLLVNRQSNEQAYSMKWFSFRSLHATTRIMTKGYLRFVTLTSLFCHYLTGITYHHGNKPSGSLHTPLSN
jgi:hypothetical protein